MAMRLLFTLSVKQTPLPVGRKMGVYRVDLRLKGGPDGALVRAESASNAVVFQSVAEGDYDVTINAYDSAGKPLLETPVTGTYTVAAPGPDPLPIAYYDAPTGFSVAALPVALPGPLPAALP